MKRTISILLAAILAACQPMGSGQSLQTNPGLSQSDIVSNEFDIFLAYWPGEYENIQQVTRQEAAARPTKDRNDPLRVFIQRVEQPAFGDNVYYVEWQNEDDRKLIRQRIYAFEKQAVGYVLRLHIFPADKEFRDRTGGAHLDSKKLAGITPDDMIKFPGCNIYLKRDGEDYAGEMRRGDCIINYNEEDKGKFYSWTQMRIRPNGFRYLDGWFHAANNLPADEKNRAWYDYQKVRQP